MEGRGGWPMTEFFRRQAALDPSLQCFTSSNSGLHTFSIPPNAGQGPSVRASIFCSPCREVDHPAASCALGYLHYPNSAPTLKPTRPGRKRPRTVCAYLGTGEDVSTPLHALSGMFAPCASSTTRQWTASMNSRGPSHPPSSAGSSFRS